jgi:hypothetical protein
MATGRNRPHETWEVVAMISPEKENVKMSNKVACDFGVEKWLKQVENRMQESLKRLLKQCRQP